MKFVGNAYSPDMLSELNVIVIQKELSYEAFQALAYDAKSVMGHYDLSKCLNLEYNPGTITLNPGDIYLKVVSQGGKIPSHFNSLDELDVELKYICMEIIRN